MSLLSRALIFIAFALHAHAAPDFARDILPLLEANCLDCHGDEAEPKGGVNLERFRTEADVMHEREVWAGVFEKVESHQMPPPKREEQPTPSEREKLLAWVSDIAARPDPTLGARDPGQPVLRRLTRLEYNNTLRDFLGLETDVFMFPERLPFNGKSYFAPQSGQMGGRVEVKVREYGQKYSVLLPGSGLPGDNRAEHGFRNRGDAMNFSPLTLEKYAALASELVESPRFAETPFFAKYIASPATAETNSEPPKRPAGGVALRVAAVKEFAPNKYPTTVAEGSATVVYQFSRGVAESFEEGSAGVFDAEGKIVMVPVSSAIEVAFGRERRKALAITADTELWVVPFITAQATSGKALLTNHRKGAKTFTLNLAVNGGAPGEGIVELGVGVLSRKDQSGPVTVTASFDSGQEQTLSHTMPEGAGKENTFFAFHAPAGQSITALRVDGAQFSGDYVLLDDLGFVTSRSLVVASTPAPAARMEAGAARALAAQRLATLLPRLFRRSLAEDDLSRYTQLFDAAVQSGQSFETGMKAALRTALTSPSFLFLVEPRRGDTPVALRGEASPAPGDRSVAAPWAGVRPLDDYELATRLSYFLWASTPDDELLALAAAGKLRDPATLEAQTRRLLADPRASELSESFATQWLRLDQLYTAKPDPQIFPAFYDGPQGKTTLHAAQLIEALLLFETVLVEDRSILDFIAADYTWLNPRLAKFYGLEAPEPVPVEVVALGPGGMPSRELKKPLKNANDFWERIPLRDAGRGGFITMSGPLTVTSLPFRTSPVKRGAWLLETVFNRPPQEPKAAFAIEGDTKEAAEKASIRQRFEAHRNKAACYSCHVRLDPPGFALERFDASGRWRETDGGQPVDARGEWNGQPFDGPAEYKAALMKDPREFTRGFIEHLLSYALGRKLEIFDMPTVSEIQRAAEADGYRLRRVVVEIAKSYPFRHTRSAGTATAPQ